MQVYSVWCLFNSRSMHTHPKKLCIDRFCTIVSIYLQRGSYHFLEFAYVCHGRFDIEMPAGQIISKFRCINDSILKSVFTFMLIVVPAIYSIVFTIAVALCVFTSIVLFTSLTVLLLRCCFLSQIIFFFAYMHRFSFTR